MRSKLCIAVVALACIANAASASVIANWNFTAGNLNPAATDSNVTVTPIAVNSSVLLNNSGAASKNWTGGANTVFAAYPAAACTSEAATVSAGGYFSFTLTPAAGQTLNLSDLQFDVANGANSGAGLYRGYVLRSSLDNYATDLAAADPTGIPTTYVEGATMQHITADLSGASFQGLTSGTPVTFRFYAWLTNASGARAVDFDNITVNGGLVPEPASLAMLVLGGLGVLVRRRK